MNVLKFEKEMTLTSFYLEDIVLGGTVSDMYQLSAEQQREIEATLIKDCPADLLEDLIAQHADIMASMIKGAIRQEQTLEAFLNEQLFDFYYDQMREYIFYKVDSVGASNDCFHDFEMTAGMTC